MRSVQAAFSYAQHGRDDQERGDAPFSRETLNRHAPRALHTLSVTGARTAAPIGHTSQRFLSTPPRSRNPGWLTQVLRHVHDLITQWEERRAHERLGEQVRDIVRSGYEGDANTVALNELPHEEVPTVDVFHAAVVLRVVGYIDGRAVINVEIDGLTRGVKAELGTQIREVYGLLGRL